MDIFFMKIQKTEINELDSIWEIKNLCVDYLSSQNIKTWDESYPSISVFEHAQKSGNLYSIFISNELIGSVCADQVMSDEYFDINWSDDNFLVIHRLMIDPKMQGKGFAKEAMIQLEKLLANNGVTSLRLAVYETNIGANALYKKLGYTLRGKVMLKNGLSFMYEKSI